MGWARCLGALAMISSREVRGQKNSEERPTAVVASTPASTQDYLRQSPGARAISQGREANDFGLGDSHASRLLPYPRPCLEGMRTPFDLWRYAGKGVSSWGSPQLRMPFSDWLELHRVQKPRLMCEVRQYMDSRYDFSGKSIPGVFMSGGRKGVPAGPGRAAAQAGCLV